MLGESGCSSLWVAFEGRDRLFAPREIGARWAGEGEQLSTFSQVLHLSKVYFVGVCRCTSCTETLKETVARPNFKLRWSRLKTS